MAQAISIGKVYRKKPELITPIELCWDNWGAICKAGGIGLLEDGKAEIIKNKKGKLEVDIRGLTGTSRYVEGDVVFMVGRTLLGLTCEEFHEKYEEYEPSKPLS